jgi:lysophospholipase L1-like esterase
MTALGKAPRWLWLVLAGSLLANAIGFGGLVYWRHVRDHVRDVARPGHYQEARRALFASLPVPRGGVVMLGDSHVDWCEWRELLGRDDVVNRGINGDTVAGLIGRVEPIVAGRPGTIAIMAGINDLMAGRAADQVAERYRELVARIAAASPATRVVVHAVLPVNRALAGGGPDREVIQALNARLRALCESGACTYLALDERLIDAQGDAQGELARELTIDGVHLTPRGYAIWRDALLPLL